MLPAAMNGPTRHVTRCLVAGVVALLPVGGTVLGVVWLESALSESWRAAVPFYFPGLGLLVALVVVYGVGLFVTTFFGRWLWRRADTMLERLPLLGTFYQSLKEVLGYDSARDRFFEAVVAVRVDDGFEIGLVSGFSTGRGGPRSTLLLYPMLLRSAAGGVALLPPAGLVRLDLRAADALRGLVSMGKTPLAPRR